jgi:hypothetical protein
MTGMVEWPTPSTSTGADMSIYRQALPQLSDRIFLTDGGIETTLIYHQGIELPHFAAFVLLEDDAGRAALRRYFEPYLSIAQDAGLGIVLESATWRASRDWSDLLGYSREALDGANNAAIELRAGWMVSGWAQAEESSRARSQMPSMVGIRPSDRGSRQRPRRRCRSQSATSSKT